MSNPDAGCKILSVPLIAAENNVVADAAKSVLAGFAAATLLATAPAAEAGVKLEKVEVKNYAKGTAPAKKASAPAEKKEKAKRQNENAGSPDAFDFKTVVFPLSIIAVGAGGLAVTTLDPGFAEMMVEASCKDSRAFAGQEVVLKDTPFFGGSGEIPSRVAGGAAPKKKGGKKGLF